MMRRARLAVLCAALSSAGLATATACGSFGEDTNDPPNPPDGASVDAPQGLVEGGVESGACALADEPTIVAKTTAAPSKIVTDGEHVYWIEGSERVMRASLVDCTTRVIATGTITALAASSETLVWGDPQLHILSTSNVDAPPTVAMAKVDEQIVVRGSVFWIDAPNATVVGCNIPCIGTYNAARVGNPQLLAVNPTRLFFFGVNRDGGTTVDLWSRDSTGGPLGGPLATNHDPKLLAASSNRAIWADVDGKVFTVPTAGGSSTLITTVPGPRAIAADDAYAYVATDTEITRVSLTGSGNTPFAGAQGRPVSIVATGEQIVWSNADELTIRRRRK
jgi:hypothetical protein